MKKIFLVLIILIYSGNVFAQIAENYFPTTTGTKWYFRTTPLDSLGNPVSELSVIKVDSFAVEGNFNGRNSKGLLTKSAPQNSVPFIPYLDTLFYSIDGNTVSQYFNFGSFIDSGLVGDSSFTGILNSLTAWYPVFDFDNPVGSDYELFTKDTTITINDQNIPIRIEVDAQRENDQNLTTVWGNYLCKKFEITFKISYLINLPPPLPPIPVRLVTYPNYFWIAEGNWIVKEFAPQTNVDLSNLGFPSFFIPGREQILINEPAYLLLEAPLSDEVLFIGDTADVVWRSRNVENVKVEVSPDSGLIWNTIHGSYPADSGKAPWVIFGGPSDKYFVKITSIEDTAATAKNIFPYDVRLKPELSLTDNLAGKKVEEGSELIINWSALNSSFINIYLEEVSTGERSLIAEGLESSAGSYTWIVSGNVSDSVAIVLVDAEFTRFYVKSGIFSITEVTNLTFDENVPSDYILYNAYPNPFNPSTTIRFGLPEGTNVRLSVYNILGERVKTIADTFLPAGYHNINFYAGNLPSGVYLLELNSNGKKMIKKVVLTK